MNSFLTSFVHFRQLLSCLKIYTDQTGTEEVAPLVIPPETNFLFRTVSYPFPAVTQKREWINIMFQFAYCPPVMVTSSL